ncbi:MAG TPA: HAMP domain-containing sensor histidine kinase [Bacteroidia bacterium]|nr:HAMP domain-containing sensor histidine kinase [Bacteroidia bacterium]
MFKTIKGKVLSVLLAFIFITMLTSLATFNYFIKQKELITDIGQKTETLHTLLLQDMNTIHEFFENETINPNFFYTGKSKLIRSHENIRAEILKSLADLTLLQDKSGFSLDDSIINLEMSFSVYTEMVDNIIQQILKRGYKDFGTEGKMRQFAHLLEGHEKEVGMINILQLRRHEKDFIIRQEEQYVKKHEQLVNEIKNAVTANTRIGKETKNEILLLLGNYSTEFKTLVFYEKKLGLRSYGGLKKDIDEKSDKIEASLSLLVKTCKEKAGVAIFRMEIIYLVTGLIFILVCIIAARAISKKISYSISDLKNKITKFVESDFTKRTVLPINDSINEIDALITNVSVMEQHIVNQMAMLKQSNKDLEMLFYATSRDIRSPLITVKRLVDVALTKTSDKTALMYLGMMKDSWQNLYNIIDELGIVTNIRSVEIKTEAIDLEILVKNVYAEFKSLEWFDFIIFSLDLKIKNKFYSSPGLVRAIFRNLIENSIKYSTKRRGQNFLKITVIDHNEDMIRIEVTDNGIGIKKEHHEKIFDMFFRGTSYAGGTGLGLYIVKCSLEKLNGAISVESEEDKGASFTVILPNNSREKNMKEKIIQKIEINSLKESAAQ